MSVGSRVPLDATSRLVHVPGVSRRRNAVSVEHSMALITFEIHCVVCRWFAHASERQKTTWNPMLSFRDKKCMGVCGRVNVFRNLDSEQRQHLDFMVHSIPALGRAVSRVVWQQVSYRWQFRGTARGTAVCND